MSNNQSVRVRDVMTGNYQLVDGLMMTDQALARMKETGAVVLIVDKRNENDEYGIVLLSDIAREVLAVSRAPERVNIYEIMSKPVVSVDPNMDIRYCARLFNKLGFSYAPVIEQGKLLGIIGYADMLLKGMCHS
ncbi:MAG: CBS domain-containing protein [Gammaproteobacteria bacterium]|jgi:predicted transcriptional regulator|nr:CBS domain-containing protein [Gammaproteobacteria bacterium]